MNKGTEEHYYPFLTEKGLKSKGQQIFRNNQQDQKDRLRFYVKNCE